MKNFVTMQDILDISSIYSCIKFPSTILLLDYLGNLKSKKNLIEHENNNFTKIYNSIYPNGISYPNDYLSYINIASRKNTTSSFDIFALEKTEFENINKSEISDFTLSIYEIIELSKIISLSSKKEFKCYIIDFETYNCIVVSRKLLDTLGDSTKIVLNLNGKSKEYEELYLNDAIISDKQNFHEFKIIRCTEFCKKYKMKT